MGKKVLKRKHINRTSRENEETKSDACVINAKVLSIAIHLCSIYIFILYYTIKYKIRQFLFWLMYH